MRKLWLLLLPLGLFACTTTEAPTPSSPATPPPVEESTTTTSEVPTTTEALPVETTTPPETTLSSDLVVAALELTVADSLESQDCTTLGLLPTVWENPIYNSEFRRMFEDGLGQSISDDSWLKAREIILDEAASQYAERC